MSLFFLITPTVILYSQGYRFDFENKKITQTGGLFLKVSPRSADIYLDETLTDKTDFLFGSVLIENLVPKKYKIRVEKENYEPWEKILEIKEKQVANAKNITLLAKNPKSTVLAENVENFWPSPNQKNLIIQEKNIDKWELKIFDLEKNIKTPAAAESKNSAELSDITFSLNSKKVFFLKDNQLFEKEDIPLEILENILDYQTTKDNIYCLDKDGWIFKLNFLFNSKEKLINQPLALEPKKKYRLAVEQDYIFLFEDKTLYFLNPKTKSLEKLSESANFVKISPDKRKALYCNDYEIWILFLEKQEEQPKRDIGDKIFLTRFSKKISDIFWWTSHYLIFTTCDKINPTPFNNCTSCKKAEPVDKRCGVKVAEIDNRDKINIYDLPLTTFVHKSSGGLKIFWNQNNKKLYILAHNKLYQSENLIR